MVVLLMHLQCNAVYIPLSMSFMSKAGLHELPEENIETHKILHRLHLSKSDKYSALVINILVELMTMC